MPAKLGSFALDTEGTGAVLAMHLVEAAVRVYNDMATFASAGVSDR